MPFPNPERRPLPAGWIEQFEDYRQVWFYVDTNQNPPLSSWIHPADLAPPPLPPRPAPVVSLSAPPTETAIATSKGVLIPPPLPRRPVSQIFVAEQDNFGSPKAPPQYERTEGVYDSANPVPATVANQDFKQLDGGKPNPPPKHASQAFPASDPPKMQRQYQQQQSQQPSQSQQQSKGIGSNLKHMLHDLKHKHSSTDSSEESHSKMTTKEKAKMVLIGGGVIIGALLLGDAIASAADVGDAMDFGGGIADNGDGAAAVAQMALASAQANAAAVAEGSAAMSAALM